ncbi:MAG: hypothetical protein M0R46_12880, partial [Candidatus Muirbacterium halophilum]|nr:hypothetical protein [Candidatus Muirbacterium halophilum]
LVFSINIFSDSIASKSDLKSVSDAAINGKIDITEHYRTISMMKTVVYNHILKNVSDEGKLKELAEELDRLEQYQSSITDIIIDRTNNYKLMFDTAKTLNSFKLNPEKIDSFYFAELLNNFSTAYSISNVFRKDENFEILNKLDIKVKELIEKGHYDKIIKGLNISDEDLLSIASYDSKSVKVIYFDSKKGKFIKTDVFPGSIIGNIKIMAVYNDKMVVFNLKTNKTIEKSFKSVLGKNTVEIDFNSNKKQYRVVPWFGEDYKISAKKGSEVRLYVKVIDEKGFTLKPSALHLDGIVFRSDDKGMITVKLESSFFKDGDNSFTVSLNDNVKADFNVNISSRDMIINYSASVGVNAKVGLEPVLAGLTVGVKPAIDGTVTFFAPDINDKWKDKIFADLFPSFSGNAAVSVGPKVKPLDIKAFGKNVGVSAGATVGANVSAKIGVGQKYLFKDPFKNDRKAEVVFLADKLLKGSNPVMGTLVSKGLQRITDVNISDYQVYGSLSISGSVGVSGNVGAKLGLIDVDTEGKAGKTHFGASGTLASASANLSGGIEGGLISGETIYGATDDRYNVVLKNSVSGNFTALDFGATLFGKDFLPNWYLTNVNGNVGCNVSFKFDKDKKLTKSMIIFSMGYRFKPNSYNQAINTLKTILKSNGATASDYAELYDIRGMTKIFIFIIDAEKTQKYFGEWVAFSRNMLTQRDPQNEQTITAKVQGIYGSVQASFAKMMETPVPYIEKTDLLLEYSQPELSIDVSLGVKVNLGIKTVFSKSKSYTDRVGYLSSFEFYPVESLEYDKDIARANREISFLMIEIKNYVQEEVKNGANYVIKKTKDGSIYIAQKLADGTVYVIEQAKDGTVKAAKYVGAKANKMWNWTLGKVGNACEYVADATANAASSVGNALTKAWNYWF